MYTLGDIPRCGAVLWPDNIAIVFEGKRYTYKQFNERINRFANFLIKSGCRKVTGLPSWPIIVPNIWKSILPRLK
jgi:acyl-CoA synthetase (AMP-forming)/AMP-acid ligase II